jgi:hypothetical protein
MMFETGVLCLILVLVAGGMGRFECRGCVRVVCVGPANIQLHHRLVSRAEIVML